MEERVVRVAYRTRSREIRVMLGAWAQKVQSRDAFGQCVCDTRHRCFPSNLVPLQPQQHLATQSRTFMASAVKENLPVRRPAASAATNILDIVGDGNERGEEEEGGRPGMLSPPPEEELRLRRMVSLHPCMHTCCMLVECYMKACSSSFHTLFLISL